MKKYIIFSLLCVPFIAAAQVADSAKRIVKMTGTVNFRDLGGYKTIDGREVKWGKVYRSADISKLTDDDLAKVEKKHIHTVIDFRGVQESAAAPDRLPAAADYTLCPAGSDSASLDPRKWMSMIKKRDTAALAGFYSETAPFGDRYKPLFQKLLHMPGDSALLYHCTGGRDRTGIASALFLYVLGVPYNTIEADYLASNVYLANWNSQMFKQMSGYLGMSEEEITEVMKLRPSLLKATFNAIEKKYGSMDKFFETELGVGKQEKARLVDLYTQ